MRRILFAAAALGPLCLVAATAQAATVSNARTTPIATATAGAGGGPEDVSITTDGSVKLTTSESAVVLNSSNAVSNAGLVQIDDANNSTGVAIQGGNAGSFTNTGTINVIESYTPADANSDGIYEAPLAIGAGRYGVRVTGASPFVGNLNTGGQIFVEGNDSAGVSVEAPLQGFIAHTGTIGVTGDRSFGLRTTATVSGDINLSGPIGATGEGSNAVNIGGDVGGALKVYSGLSANAYGTATRATVTDTLKLIQSTPSELKQSGATLVVGADVAGGIFFGAPPVGTAAGATADLDGDGVADGSEAASSITNFGSAPAILIGGTGRNVSIGAFGTGDNAYGLVFRGALSVNGLYDGIAATGIQVGGTGSTATLAGGMRLVGAVSAAAYEANSTAIRVGAGGVVPELRVENNLTSTVARSAVSPASSATAYGVRVEAGGSLSRLTNYGTIAATATGPTVSATAVLDQGGALSTVVNQGVISAALTPAVEGESVSGRTIALDLRANTTGVTLTQSANPNPIVLTTAVDSTGKVVNTTTPTVTAINGDILLGSGPNTVSLQAGSVAGALDLGSAASSLSISGGATYAGFLTHVGPSLSIDVSNGSLTNTNASTLQLTSLNVGSGSTLSFAVDAATGQSTTYDVSGAATLANGAKIGLNLRSRVEGTQTYHLIRSPQLSVGAIDSLIPETPYVTIATLRLDKLAGALDLDVRRRTAAEAGFNAAQTAAYDAVYAALPNDAAVQAALFTPTDRAGFVGLYDQMLPDYSGGAFRVASAASRAISRAAADGGPGGAWIQEIAVGAKLDGDQGAAPFNGWGWGVAGGVERSSRIGALGLQANFITSDIHDPDAPGIDRQTVTSLGGGLYWRAHVGGLTFDAQGGANWLHNTSERQFIVTDSAGTQTLKRTAEGKFGGWTGMARAGLAYQLDLGGFFLKPQAHVDYFHMSQGSYAETGGGDAFNLTFAERTGSETSGTVSLALGAAFGQTVVWRPQIELGYRSILSGDPGTTRAHFAGGSDFSLYALGLESGGALGRLTLKATGETYDISIGAGAEHRDGYLEGDVQFRARIQF